MTIQSPRPQGPLLLGVREAAQALSVSRGTIYGLVRSGILPTPSKLGTRSLWPAASVQDAAERIIRGEARRT